MRQQSQGSFEYEFNTQKQIEDAYRQIENQVRDKFKSLTTHTIQQFRNNVKRNQNKITQEESKYLISQERQKIIQQMIKHVKDCSFYQCKEVKQVTLLYGFLKQKNMEDKISLICNENINGLGYKNSECYFATKINDKMYETHKLFKGL